MRNGKMKNGKMKNENGKMDVSGVFAWLYVHLA
jgi:hypothetical protein